MSQKIYVKEAPFKGMGVFAAQDIKEGELIEKCYLLKVTTDDKDLGPLHDYVFNYPHTGKFKHLVLPLGAGCIYNHDDNPNAIWYDSKEQLHFDYIALRDIKKDAEICTHYGELYWKQMAERNKDIEKHTNEVKVPHLGDGTGMFMNMAVAFRKGAQGANKKKKKDDN